MNKPSLAFAEIHWPLIVVTLLVTGLGIVNIHSSAAVEDPTLYLSQLRVLALGAVLAGVLLLPDYRASEGIAYAFYGVFCLLLVGVIVNGVSAGGATRWLQVGSFRFQPSEFAKLATVFCVARYLSTRVEPDGYTLAMLVRPLNLSRPLAMLGVVAIAWKKPWLVDPVGELARLLRAKLGGSTMELGGGLWFRVLVLGLIVAALGLAIVAIVRAERTQALLHTWPPGRRNRMILVAVVIAAMSAAVVAAFWRAPFMHDPFGVAMQALIEAAGPGGIYAARESRIGLRLLLVIVGVVYLAAGFLALRASRARAVDLMVAPIDLLLLPAVLIMAQPDLDNAGIIVLAGVSVMLVVGIRWRTLVTMALLGVFIVGVAWFGVLKDYQKRRVLTFIDPQEDVQGAGWNAVQSMIAVGSGQWTGKGHREGTQTQLSFLPEQHTDFAFSVWAEETGFVGCALLLALYLLMLVFGLAIAAEARDAYGALLAAGVSFMFAWEIVINVGMVIGLLPVVGMTLPYFSFGGSSLLAKLTGTAVLLNVHLRRKLH